MGKNRLEAFSDGVVAVAITLLVLDLHADVGGDGSLGHQLWAEWPSFAAYAVSFFTIGVIWVNHHALFVLAARVDRPLMFLNILLLMWVTTIPFTTATLAAYLRVGGGDARIAVLLYGTSMEGMAVSFTLILRHLIRRELLLRPVSSQQGRAALRRFGLGTLVYPITVAFGLVLPVASILVYGVVTVFYVLEQTPILPESSLAQAPVGPGS